LGLAVDQVASVQWHSLWPSFRYFTAIVLVGAAILSTYLFLCGGGFSWTSGYIAQDFAEEKVATAKHFNADSHLQI
jgi:hypothetical protein